VVKEILEVQPLTLAEVKKILTQRGRKGELSYIQRVTLEHATRFSSFSASEARSMIKKLMKKFEMEEEMAIQLVNIVPTTVEELETFLAKSPRPYTKEDLKKILDILTPKKKKSGKGEETGG